MAFCTNILQSAAQVMTPKEYFGYELGSNFTSYYRVVGYLEKIASQSPLASFRTYGKTYEGRPLTVLIISSEQNIKNLEHIRNNNLRKAGLSEGDPESDGKIIVWLSYNVHGNEASSTEAAIATAYRLLSNDEKINRWLDNTIVVIDPCLNPDGRERYVHWFEQNKSSMLLTDPMGAGHQEPWPGGRMNHYLFDLNRDWTWLSQMESVHRIGLYNEWMPQIHVDFHEQGYNDPYYFAPAAQPYHEMITDWQKKFQIEIGKNHAKYFDENKWLYFTKERFDLFYPGYGDTYPIFNGAIGMTYEQAGGGIAGLGIQTATGDTLTLADRILHHYTTSLSTIEIASIHALDLEKNFIQFFKNSHTQASNGFNTYIIKHEPGNNRINKLITILDQHKILYGQFNKSNIVKGYDFHQNRNVTINVEPADLIIPAQQPKSVLVKVLFEPVSMLEDSLTYDITSWSIPFAFGLQTFATVQTLKPEREKYTAEQQVEIQGDFMPYGYALIRNDLSDFSALSALFQKGLNVRTNYTALTINNHKYPAGSYFILTGDNMNFAGDLYAAIADISSAQKVNIDYISTGFSDDGPDLGSSKLRLLNKHLKVGVLYGDPVRPYDVGEIWHLFEQELHYPLIRLNNSLYDRSDLRDIDVLIIPQGYYGSLFIEEGLKKISQWVSNGGRLIVIGNALRYFADTEDFNLKTYLDEAEKEQIAQMRDGEDYLKNFDDNERLTIKDRINGGIYKTRLDNTHPVAFGYPDYYFTLKTDEARYALLTEGWNIATISGPQDKVSGFSGSNTEATTYKALVVGMEESGNGEIVYFVDNPLFRSFWENGKLMFCNAIFMP